MCNKLDLFTGVTIILRYPFSSLFDDDPTYWLAQNVGLYMSLDLERRAIGDIDQIIDCLKCEDPRPSKLAYPRLGCVNEKGCGLSLSIHRTTSSFTR